MRLLLSLLLLVPGCSKKAAGLPQPTSPVKGTDYYPFGAGATLTFRGGTGVGSGTIETERQDWDVSLTNAPDGKSGYLINRRGRGILNAMTMTVGVRPEGIVSWTGLFGLAKTEFTPPYLELPATISPGMKWTWSGTTKGVPATIESVLEGLEKIKVPAGEFTCLRIRRTMGPATVTHWYAQGKGPIRVEMQNPGGRVHLERDK